jgi:hypothetical protein
VAASPASACVHAVLVAQALQYMHGCGHWHGDVKLENVLMDAEVRQLHPPPRDEGCVFAPGPHKATV